MKRLFAIYCAAILGCASTGYASLSSMLRADLNTFNWGYLKGMRNWVWTYSGPATTNCLYRLNGGYVDSVAVFFYQGYSFTDYQVTLTLNKAIDRPGQYWVRTGEKNRRLAD
jgi:hypothetical protein